MKPAYEKLSAMARPVYETVPARKSAARNMSVTRQESPSVAGPTARVAAIRLSGVSKSFGRTRVLRDLDLEVAWGDVLAIVGPNGSGKSTLLRLLATLTRPDEGTVSVAGLDLSRGGREARRLMGVVTHEPLLYEDLTVHENLAFHIRMFGLDRARERIDSAAERMGVSDRLHQRIGTLSHGLRKRVSIARALLHDPRILLMDEPESGLDQVALRMLESVIADRSDPYRTVVMTTHNLDRAIETASSMAVLARGEIAYRGSLDSVAAESIRDTYVRYTDGAL